MEQSAGLLADRGVAGTSLQDVGDALAISRTALRDEAPQCRHVEAARDGEILASPIGVVPTIAALLAKATLAPDLVLAGDSRVTRDLGEEESPLVGVLQRCYELAMATEVPADGGAPIVAYFPVYFPEELVDAAGLRAYSILGGGTTVEAKLADAAIGSFICSICRSTVELGLGDAVAGVSRLYVPPICDPAKHLVGIWGRHFPDQQAEQLALPQNVEIPAAVDFICAQYQQVRTDLAELAGHEVPDEAIRASIRAYNENRALLRELYRIRRDEPGVLAAVEAYLLTRAASRLAVREHNALLAQAIDLAQSRRVHAQDKPRVVLVGGFCEQPPLEMIEALEDACFVVDDDLLLGRRWLTEDVSTEGDPVRALAQAYVACSTSNPVQHDSRKPKDLALLEMVRRANADGVVISAAKFCEPGLDDQVALAKALEAADISYLVLEFEEKMTSFEQMAMQIETFAETLLFD
jgi:benzoyl-CoA reductase subunit C